MIFCLPALLILVAAGLARLRQMWMLGAALVVILLFSLQGIFFVYGNDFDNERDASGAATDFILDHSKPGDGILFYIPATRAAYEFFRSVRAGQNTASPDFIRPFGPEILFPYHRAGLDYRDFTGKPAPEFLHTIGTTHPRVWIMLMNNGGANPDPTTVMMTSTLVESFSKIQTWEFTKVEVRLVQQTIGEHCADQAQKESPYSLRHGLNSLSPTSAYDYLLSIVIPPEELCAAFSALAFFTRRVSSTQ